MKNLLSKALLLTLMSGCGGSHGMHTASVATDVLQKIEAFADSHYREDLAAAKANDDDEKTEQVLRFWQGVYFLLDLSNAMLLAAVDEDGGHNNGDFMKYMYCAQKYAFEAAELMAERRYPIPAQHASELARFYIGEKRFECEY